MGMRTRGCPVSECRGAWAAEPVPRITWLLALAFLLVAASAPLSAGFRVGERVASAHGLSEMDRSILGLTSWESRAGMRTLQQAASAPDSDLSGRLILAANQTDRRDVLDDFKVYRGGWDIRNQHYWSSVGWTGLPGFIIAAAWLLLALLSILLLCCKCCCCRHREFKRPKGGRGGFIFGAILLALLSAAAIGGTVWLYLGQERFHDETADTLDYVVDQSRLVQSQLNNVSVFLLDVRSKQVLNQTVVPTAQQAQLQTLSITLVTSANDLKNKTDDNSGKISNALDWVRIALIILAAVMLGLVILGFFFTLCGFFHVVKVLVVLGWILVAATWVLVGVFLLLHNALDDTCVAMREWVANPTASTNLDDILPCVDPNQANQTLRQTTAIAATITNFTNTVITAANRDIPRQLPIWYNASGPPVPLLDQSGPVNFTSADAIWRGFVCQTDASGRICTTQGRLTPEIYRELLSGNEIGRNLTIYGPFLTDLQNCDFVRRTFVDITSGYCPNLLKWTRWIYTGLILVSGGTLLAIPLWILLNHKQKSRKKAEKVRPPIYAASAQPPRNPAPAANGAPRPASDGVVHMA